MTSCAEYHLVGLFALQTQSEVHRGGTVYFPPHLQQPSQGRSPARRPKAAIPIVDPTVSCHFIWGKCCVKLALCVLLCNDVQSFLVDALMSLLLKIFHEFRK
jgi:hypothetical protein